MRIFLYTYIIFLGISLSPKELYSSSVSHEEAEMVSLSQPHLRLYNSVNDIKSQESTTIGQIQNRNIQLIDYEKELDSILEIIDSFLKGRSYEQVQGGKKATSSSRLNISALKESLLRSFSALNGDPEARFNALITTDPTKSIGNQIYSEILAFRQLYVYARNVENWDKKNAGTIGEKIREKLDALKNTHCKMVGSLLELHRRDSNLRLLHVGFMYKGVVSSDPIFNDNERRLKYLQTQLGILYSEESTNLWRNLTKIFSRA